MIQPANKIIIVEPGLHAELGASSSDRWINCPGSVKATRGKPNQSTEFTAQGSAAHALAELCRSGNVPTSHYRGWKIKAEGREYKVDDEFVFGVQTYLDQCDETAPIDSIPVTEVMVRYDRWVPGGFGTSDDGRLHPEIFRVTDLKFGVGHQVWAKKNSQIRIYGIGMLEEFRWLGYNPQKTILGISQPRLDHYDEEELSVKELLEWADDTLPKAVKEVEEGTRFNPGKHCAFCKIRDTCRVRANAYLQTVLQDFEDLDAVEEQSQIALEYVMNAELSPDEIAKLLPALDNIKKWASHVELGAVKSLIAGKPIGDWKLVEGRSNRKYEDEDNAAGNLASMGVPEEHIYEDPKVRSPAKIEKLVGKKAFKPIADELVKKPPGKPKLAPGSDPRPAMTHQVLEEFENLDSDDEAEFD